MTARTFAALLWPALLLFGQFQPTAYADPPQITIVGSSIVVTGHVIIDVWADRPVEVVGADCHRGYWWPSRHAAYETLAPGDGAVYHLTGVAVQGCSVTMPPGGWVEVEERSIYNPAVIRGEMLHSQDVNELLWYLDHWFEHEGQAERDGVEGIDVRDLNAYLDGWFRRQNAQSSGSQR